MRTKFYLENTKKPQQHLPTYFAYKQLHFLKSASAYCEDPAQRDMEPCAVKN